MATLSKDTTPVPCLRCGRPVIYPAAVVRESLRKQRRFIAFCSRLCNLTYVAEQGAKQQEAIAFEEHHDDR